MRPFFLSVQPVERNITKTYFWIGRVTYSLIFSAKVISPVLPAAEIKNVTNYFDEVSNTYEYTYV